MAAVEQQREHRPIRTLFVALLLSSHVSCGDKHCNNVLPGIQKIVRGVDITKMNIFDADEPGYGRNVIQLTCNEGKKYTNPHDNLEYDMPDQISSFITATGGFLETTAHMWKSRKDVKKTFSMHLSAEVGLLGLAVLSLSASFAKISEDLSGSKHRMIDVQASVSNFQATFAPGLVLGLQGDAGRWWDYLPDDIHSEPEPYFDFIRDYGTHYFVQGKFGGSIRTLFTVDEKMFEEKDSYKISLIAEAKFVSITAGKMGLDYGSEDIWKKFSEHTSNRTDYFGGDQNLASDDFTQWVPSVAKRPWVLGGRLLPIYTMAGNTQKAKNMKLAMETYLGTGYLHELERIVFAADTEWRKNKGMIPVDEELMDRWKWAISEEKDKLIPDMERVKALGAEIEYQLITPDWWDSTSICVKYDSSFDEYYTRGPGTSPFCALVDSYTLYLDQMHNIQTYLDSGERPTLKLTTGLFSPSPEEWFYSLEWCMQQDFRKGTGLKDSCQKINNYPEGLNVKFDIRWRVRIPDEMYDKVPHWFKNVKLCMKFPVNTMQWTWKNEQKQSQFPNSCFPERPGGSRTSPKLTCRYIHEWSKWIVPSDIDSSPDPCVRSWGILSPRL